MGTSVYFGAQVASIPHLERGDVVATDLRSDIDAAFLLLEADLASVSFDQSTLGLNKASYTAFVEYDFASQGGLVSTIDFVGEAAAAVEFPINAVITNVRLDVQDAFTSGGAATLAIGFDNNSTTDVKVVTPYTNAPFVAPGTVSLEAIAYKLTAAGVMQLTIAGAALTAGKVRALVDFFVTE